uniref:U-box domain-containing protein 63 n=1 Tax=Anthurium amnicola TaxID=1678845 RepID=A0A1D1XVJ8_9ARAE
MSGAGMQTPSPAGVAPSGAPPNAHPPHAGRSPAAPLQPQPQPQPHHHHQLPSSLSLGLLPLPLPPSSSRTPPDHYNAIGPEPIASAYPAAGEHPAAPIPRVRLADIASYDGAPCGAYAKAVEALSGSLARHNAVVIELGGEDSTMVRCALESARMYFKAKAQCGGVGGGMDSWRKSNRGVYMYRAGRALEDGDLSPPCMSDAFKCLGKAARVALCAVARHLRLRSDVFNHLLDDSPLPPNEVSSSVLVATFSHNSPSNGKGGMGGVKPGGSEVEKGLLTLIASDNPGIQVCDPNGRWYLADGASGSGDLLLLTGRALSHATAGLRPAATYRMGIDCFSGVTVGGRASLVFKFMPQCNAILDCSPIAAAGHMIPQSFVPITVSQFMDDLSAEEDAVCNRPDNYEAHPNLIREPSLRSVLSDPLSGAFLEDAVVVSCGHSFGGDMLKKVIERARCTICNSDIETGTLVPNYALRAAAMAVKNEDDRRLFHNAVLRKRRKEMAEQMDALKRLNKVLLNAF